MNRRFTLLLFLLYFVLPLTQFSCVGQSNSDGENHFTKDDYSKQEVHIEMRDGAKLFTSIYAPIDDSQEYPVIIKRTPYSCSPYGPDTMPNHLSHNPDLVRSGYIFVFQDVRGRWNSEGVFENVKPPYSLWDENATDELTDSYDTFDWLVKNLENFNGNIGQYGNSYPGWTTLIGARSSHPNLKAVMAMAPVTNFYFEDFQRYGLCAMNYIPVLNAFGTYKDEPTTDSWYDMKEEIFYTDVENKVGKPYYDFFLKRLALTNFDDVLAGNVFWDRIKAHPNYDEFQEKRNWLNYLDEKMSPQIMVVGGWHDEQNLFGILNSYKTLSKKNPDAQLVVGPWSHGHNKRRDSLYCLGDVCFGTDISKEFQETIEFNYFEHHLKGKGKAPDFSVRMFDTGTLEWQEFDEFPDSKVKSKSFYLNIDRTLAQERNQSETKFRMYQSDPFKPVPYLAENDFHRMAPKSYMTADQRFLQDRQDVISWTTDILEEDLTVCGEPEAIIQFSTDMEDADLYVKIIDVYPDNRSGEEHDLPDNDYQGYQRLIRVGYIRGRFRNSFSNPEPFEPGVKTEIKVPLLEVYHTFKKGHRIMIQIQSSMFPLFDMNPQKYVENIYEATADDFEPSVHRVYSDSKIVLPIKNKK